MFLFFFFASTLEIFMAFLKHGAQSWHITYYFPFCSCAATFANSKPALICPSCPQHAINKVWWAQIWWEGCWDLHTNWVSFCFCIFLWRVSSCCGTCWDRRVTVMIIARDISAHRNNMRGVCGNCLNKKLQQAVSEVQSLRLPLRWINITWGSWLKIRATHLGWQTAVSVWMPSDPNCKLTQPSYTKTPKPWRKKPLKLQGKMLESQTVGCSS